MRRRGFLGAIAAAVAGAALDPERALWIPGRKLYSLPPVAAPSVSPLGMRIRINYVREYFGPWRVCSVDVLDWRDCPPIDYAVRIVA